MFLGKGQQNIQGGIGVITMLHRISKGYESRSNLIMIAKVAYKPVMNP